jgi:hypothetical protein
MDNKTAQSSAKTEGNKMLLELFGLVFIVAVVGAFFVELTITLPGQFSYYKKANSVKFTAV